MIPSQWRGLVLGRRKFWLYVAVIMALKVGVVIAFAVAPRSLSLLGHADTWLMVALAYVVGARFVDLGWPRWVGFTSVLLLMFVIPFVLVLIQPSGSTHKSENFLDRVPDFAWVSTLALFALLAVAGSRTRASITSNVPAGPGEPTPGT